MIIEVKVIDLDIYIYILTSVQLEKCVSSLFRSTSAVLADWHIPGNWIVSQPCTICSPPRRNTQLGWTDPGWSSARLRLAWTDTSRMPSMTYSLPVSQCRCSPPERFRSPAIFPSRRPSPKWLASSRDPPWLSSPAPRYPSALVSMVCSSCRVSKINHTYDCLSVRVYFIRAYQTRKNSI